MHSLSDAGYFTLRGAPRLISGVVVRHEVVLLAVWSNLKIATKPGILIPVPYEACFFGASKVGMKPFRQSTKSCLSKRGGTRETGTFREASSRQGFE